MNNLDVEIKRDIEILWNYLCLKSEPETCECIIGLGSILKSVPQKCAQLYKDGFGEYIIFSGNCGKGTEGVIEKTEAEIFEDIAVEEGVPREKILTEKNATNTYENFKYSLGVLESKNIHPRSFLIVGKPYQERRALNIAQIELKGLKFKVASFFTSLEDFIDYVEKNNLMSLDDVINEVVAEINIGLIAPSYGLQQVDEIPEAVLDCYNRLCQAGYNRYLISEEVIKKTLTKWSENKTI